MFYYMYNDDYNEMSRATLEGIAISYMTEMVKQLANNLSIVYPQYLWVYAGHWPLTVGIHNNTLRHSFSNIHV